LPDSALAETKALVTISVVISDSQPKHFTELSYTNVDGTPIKCMKEMMLFLLQTPDQYLAW